MSFSRDAHTGDGPGLQTLYLVAELNVIGEGMGLIMDINILFTLPLSIITFPTAILILYIVTTAVAAVGCPCI